MSLDVFEDILLDSQLGVLFVEVKLLGFGFDFNKIGLCDSAHQNVQFFELIERRVEVFLSLFVVVIGLDDLKPRLRVAVEFF